MKRLLVEPIEPIVRDQICLNNVRDKLVRNLLAIGFPFRAEFLLQGGILYRRAPDEERGVKDCPTDVEDEDAPCEAREC